MALPCRYGGSHLLKSTTCEQSQLHIFCILRLLGGVARLFVVRAIVPAKASASGFLFQKRSAAEVRIHCQGGRLELISPQIIIERSWTVFWHLLGLAAPIILFSISVVLLLIAIVLTGFASHSETVQLYMSLTSTFLGACHLVSISGSPFYHHLSNLCIGVVHCTSGKTRTLVLDSGVLQGYHHDIDCSFNRAFSGVVSSTSLNNSQ
ncbi:hypothetical protein EDD22DRAFT_389260 [Suillus occidentalis]|nr:hypothetical protein EDD22DRAFT_389260 [Suillus occidentalis]